MSFVKLDRKLLTWGWKDRPNMVALWIEILLQANYYENEWHGKVYEVGSFPTSVAKLSASTGLTTQQVRTCLNNLKSTNEITITTTSQGTKISVNKWAEYQCCEEEPNKPNNKRTNKQSTNDQQTINNTIRNKEIKERKEVYIRPTLDEVKAYCKERNNGVDADRWFNYYSANGWKVGKNPMKDWKAAVRTWEQKKPEEEKTSTERYKVPWLD